MALILISTALLALGSLARAAVAMPNLAVGPQYVTTHVYVAPRDIDRFVESFVTTFGGTATKKQLVNVTPTPSTTEWRAVASPVGALSVFGFTTPYPWPFGAERNGFLVSDFDAAVKAAHANGAGFLTAPFEDPIGRDAVIQWPGGVNMQIYWHKKAPHSPALAAIPENRVYVAPEQADAFIRAYLAFSQGKVIKDDRKAPGIEIGEPFNIFRRVLIDSGFGKTLVFATDGQMPYPWGRETTGYEVKDLDATILKAEAAGVYVRVEPINAAGRLTSFFEFPGGYTAEVHTAAP
ncbi:MAG: glyoxalase [Methylovirgula sp.]|uniref:glyoxalase n=1 Tax=Methylovirgula sp. TaxID=1978224 RepID=UPI0030767457